MNIKTQDDLKDSIIVPVRRVPYFCSKHLLKRRQLPFCYKPDVVVVSPKVRRLRSKFYVEKYLDKSHPERVSFEKFDFVLDSKKRNGIVSASRRKARNHPNTKPLTESYNGEM